MQNWRFTQTLQAEHAELITCMGIITDALRDIIDVPCLALRAFKDSNYGAGFIGH